ncbi:MAG: HIT domain-containing protein [Bdellovibrionota bacterium]
MDHLWAPWRMSFIQQAHDGKQLGCVLCELQKLSDGPENLILHRGKQAFVIMNKFPYNCGHVMVVPNAHGAEFAALDPACGAELQLLLQKALRAIDKVYKPQGFNIGMNLGSAGGAGIPAHLHYHVVPRWNGDTNFMPVVGQTKVLPESLEESYAKLSKALSS